MPNEIALIEENKLTVVNLFDLDYVDIVIKDIKKNVKNLVQDMTTEKGRKQIASTAYTIAKLKTRIDNKGKELTEDWARQKKAVDNGRKKFREELDTLKEEIRKPLTDWENKEKNRVENCNKRLIEIEMFKSLHDVSSIEIDDAIKKVKELHIYEWKEFEHRAKFVSDEAIKYLQTQKEKVLKAEQEQAELAVLRKEKLDNERKEREDKIKLDAKEKAEKEGREELKRLELKAKQREESIKKEKLEAENLAKEQEKLRKEQLKKAEEDSKIAIEEARKKEREKIETEKKKEQEEVAKRKADKKHRNKIIDEIFEDLSKIKTSPNYLRAIINAIAKDEIRHTSIKY
ncbi:hypothetical protein KAH94_04205 [bacterium]|nr:hypothetical protein [bacterium]